MTTPTKLHIGEVADLIGITPKAIRHYHQLGLLPQPERDENGYRLYGVAALRQLQTILRLQNLGLTLRQITFILHADHPDDLLCAVLEQRRQTISEEIQRLHAQQAAIDVLLAQERDHLAALLPKEQTTHHPPTASIVRDVLRPHSTSLADVVVAVEAHLLNELDQYAWPEGYAAFWEQMAQAFLARVRPNEHPVIVWLERYLALPDIAPDDLQAQAWLQELRHSPLRPLLASTLAVPVSSALPDAAHQHLQRLLPLVMFENADGLQRAFLSVLMGERLVKG